MLKLFKFFWTGLTKISPIEFILLIFDVAAIAYMPRYCFDYYLWTIVLFCDLGLIVSHGAWIKHARYSKPFGESVPWQRTEGVIVRGIMLLCIVSITQFSRLTNNEVISTQCLKYLSYYCWYLVEFIAVYELFYSILKTLHAHNSSWLEYGGSPDKAVRVAFVYALDKYLKNAGKYNKNESKITFVDVADCLVYVSNSISTLTSYANQTKKAITNEFIYEAMTDFLKKNLEIYFVENPTSAEIFANQVLVNKRSRENAENTRLSIKKKLTGTLDIANRVEKFVSCRSKDVEKRELYIVEGDSALSSCKLGRDADFQAIIPVRGKTLNCLKSTYDKIFKNEIIVDLLKVIGCGAEIKSKSKEVSGFDISMLKWNKIIICTDADEDGFQIRALVLTLFYRLLPTLLKMGKVYIAESPLFEITTKEETYFAYDEKEKAEILKKLEDEKIKYTLQRSKGLGENEADMMSRTTMCPQTRRLIAVTPTDAEATAKMFDVLLGDALSERKKFITDYGHLYIKDADV